MTPEILLVFGILLGAMVLFVTGFLRMDLTALLVLAALALTGLVTPTEALSGFSSSAVITVAGMFVISAGLGRTGIAGIVGRQVLKMAGTGEARLIVVIMVTAGLLSSVMNNIGVAAMMLPVVMDIARRTRRPPSRLLLPLALACLMGGLLTLVGTPPNILVSDALLMQGLEPFQLFDFTPIGLVILGTGIAFVAVVGRHLLPSVDPRRGKGAGGGAERAAATERSAAAVGRSPGGSRPAKGSGGDADLVESYDLEERIFSIRLPRRSLLDGTTLAESRLGSALGLHVLAIDRADPGRRRRPRLAPGPGEVLRGGDRLIVQGLPDLLDELRHARHLELEEADPAADDLISREIGFAEARIPDGSSLVGQTLNRADLRQWSGVVVLAILREDEILRAALEDTPLERGDALLMQGRRDHLDALGGRPEFDEVRRVTLDEAMDRYRLEERFFTFRITPASILAGRSLRDSRLGDAVGLTVLGIRRDEGTLLVPGPDEVLRPDDLLLVKTHPDTLVVLRGLQKLVIEAGGDLLLDELDSEKVGLLEVVLSPRTKLMGSTPRQIGFRDKYGLTVLALWRAGRVFRTNLRDKPLEFGDSLLVFGPRDRLALLARDPDFLVLTESLQEPPRSERAPLSLVVLAVTLGPVLLGWVPIGVAVLMGATLMVLTRCLTANEAYRSIEWPAVVLIAGMLPLGIAMDRTGAAQMLAEQVVGTSGALGPRGVLAGLCLMTALGAQVIPSVALVVVMAPIALTTAADLGISPHTLMMGVALSAASLSSPVAHPANVLVMGPGGYRYMDYVKLGAPLTAIVLVLVILLLPILLPFHP